MAYQNNSYGWSNMHEIYEPAYYPRHHHQKRRVAIYDEPVVETNQSYHVQEIETDPQGTRFGGRNYNTYDSHDQQDTRFVGRSYNTYDSVDQQDTRFGGRNYNTYESVDQEADAFIQHEHRRMAMAKRHQ
ncbi:uncharacterized protein LOC127105877 [Lathyrus oleraceus]|uniref:uncharacterized protein LOC127105877 n=1 Tax=Pisum sativum TaxID=3888 RepID=UPI001FC4161A|nr:uncharacterized protein LOC127105877 [Pisum sativum]